MKYYEYKALFMRLAFFMVAILLAGGCNLPKDPEGTAQRVQGGTLRVGVLGDELGEVDQIAIETVAAAFDAEVDYRYGPAHALIASLESGDIELIAGDIPADTPFQHDVGLTRPFGSVVIGGEQKDRVLALRMGENGFLTRVEHALPEKRGR